MNYIIHILIEKKNGQRQWLTVEQGDGFKPIALGQQFAGGRVIRAKGADWEVAETADGSLRLVGKAAR